MTNNSTWIRIGYRIYSLWRFKAATDYNCWQLTQQLTTKYTLNDLTRLITATLANRWLVTAKALFEDFWLRTPTHALTHSESKDWLLPLPTTDWLLCIAFPLQHRAVPIETLAFPLLVAMQPTCTQQYRSGKRIYVTIRPRLLGNHATRQYRVPSNDRCV
jgi:hypothetical protein